MNKRKYIKLNKISQTRNKLTYEFTTSLNLFKKNSFFVEYTNREIRAPESINAIPFAAVMAPISWATGADLIIPCLDETYISALEDCGQYFKKWYSKRWSFKGQLMTRPVKNEYPANRVGVLFSGGLDSFATYVRHKEEKPVLFTYFGMDVPLSKTRLVEIMKKEFSEFSRDQEVDICWIYTNVRETLDEKRLNMFCKKQWHSETSFALYLTSFTAPLGYRDIAHILIASSNKGPQPFGWGSDIDLDPRIRWASTSVSYDLVEYNRMEKIERFFKNEPSFHKFLRVCWAQFDKLNCSRCEKCLRTVCALLANNIDPNLCNFNINDDTLLRLKKVISQTHRRYNFFYSGEICLTYWREILTAKIERNQIRDMHGSKEFFDWFLDFKPLQKKQNPVLAKVCVNLGKAKFYLMNLGRSTGLARKSQMS